METTSSSCSSVFTPTLIIIGVYAILSRVFYTYPILKTKKRGKPLKKDTDHCVVISHRGGAGENVENTIEAFDYSVKLNADVLELDCHITKDGHVVVAHDNNLFRIAGVNKEIQELNFDELPMLLSETLEEKVETVIKRAVSTSLITNTIDHHPSHEPHKNRIPKLETIFQRYKRMPINLDIKINNDELIKKVYELIVKYEREEITVWGSFLEDVKLKCLKLNPRIPTYFSKLGCFKLLLLTITGLLPFVPLKDNYLEILMPHFILKSKKFQLPFSTRLALTVAQFVFMRKSFIRHLQNRGIEVYLWVLNNEEEFDYALELGVDGIITDYPTRLVEYLEKRKQKPKAN